VEDAKRRLEREQRLRKAKLAKDRELELKMATSDRQTKSNQAEQQCLSRFK